MRFSNRIRWTIFGGQLRGSSKISRNLLQIHLNQVPLPFASLERTSVFWLLHLFIDPPSQSEHRSLEPGPSGLHSMGFRTDAMLASIYTSFSSCSPGKIRIFMPKMSEMSSSVWDIQWLWISVLSLISNSRVFKFAQRHLQGTGSGPTRSPRALCCWPEPSYVPRRTCLTQLLSYFILYCCFVLSSSFTSHSVSAHHQSMSFSEVPKPNQGTASTLQNKLTKYSSIFSSAIPTGIFSFWSLTSQARESGDQKGTFFFFFK